MSVLWAETHGLDRVFMVVGRRDNTIVYLTYGQRGLGYNRWEPDQELACERGGGFATREAANKAKKAVKIAYGNCDTDISDIKTNSF